MMVGIIKSDKKNNRRPPEKFFKECSEKWVELYGELLPIVDGEKAIPSFWKNGAEKNHQKIIITELRERAENRNVLWTKEECLKRYEAFIRRAFDDDYISKHFQLRIISINRSAIFNNQITPKNGTHKQSSTKNTNRNSKTAGAELLLASLKKDLLGGRE